MRRLILLLTLVGLPIIGCGDASDGPEPADTERTSGKADDADDGSEFPKAQELRNFGVLEPGSSVGGVYFGIRGDGEVLIRDLVELQVPVDETVNFILEFDNARVRCPCPYVESYSLWLVQLDGEGEIVDGYPLDQQPEADEYNEFAPLAFSLDWPGEGRFALAIDAITFFGEGNDRDVLGGWTLEHVVDEPVDE